MNDLIKPENKTPITHKRKAVEKKLDKLGHFFKTNGKTVEIVIIMVSMMIGVYLLKSSIEIGAKSLMENYSEEYEAEKKSAYDSLYSNAYSQAYKNYHLSSDVNISIGDLQETQKLEVLTANDVEFITENRDDNTGNITAWLEVEGEGTYVIDLQAAEYIIDNERRHITVRIPNPELSNVHIIKTTKCLFVDDLLNGSYKEGVDLALKQRNEASVRIEKALMSNQYLYNNAQSVAQSTIQNLVKQFNTEIPDLTVQVEFMD